MGSRVGLDGRKISSPPGFDPGPSSPYSVAIPTELPCPHSIFINIVNEVCTGAHKVWEPTQILNARMEK